MEVTRDACDVLEAIVAVDADETLLDAIAAIAHERAENIRLRREGEWLKGRIEQEERRLANGHV